MLGITAEQWVLIVGALLAISEVLASIPSIKANSIFQIIVGLLKKVVGKE
jgi:hypothetical protein